MHINAYKDHTNEHVDRNFSVPQNAHRHVGWVTLSYENMKDGEWTIVNDKVSYQNFI